MCRVPLAIAMSILTILLAVDPVVASPMFTGQGTGIFGVYIESPFGNQYLYDAAMANVHLTVNSGTSVTYDSQTFFSNSFTKTLSGNITVGLGQTVPITLALTFDPVSATQTNEGPYTLVPAVGGVLNVQQPNYPSTWWATTMSGSYVVTGPQNTASGTFSYPAGIVNTQYSGNKWDLDGSAYPSSVSLVGHQQLQWNTQTPQSPYAVDTTVDGAYVRVYFGGGFMDYTAPAQLLAVPEPGCLAIVSLGAVGLMRRRAQLR